jgi:hypothetical protein
MIIDELNQFCDATALSTVGTGYALIGSQIDLGAAGEQVGDGEPLYVVFTVTTTVTSGGAATVQFIVASDAAEAIAADGSATEHVATAAIGKATLVAGYQFALRLPPGVPAYERYLGILQNVGTAALTAGAIDAQVVRDVPRHVIYAGATGDT